LGLRGALECGRIDSGVGWADFYADRGSCVVFLWLFVFAVALVSLQEED